MLKISKYIIQDLLRNWIVLLYTAFWAAATFGLFMLEGQSDKAMLGLLNIGLLVVPMVTIIFATIYYYNMYEFIVLLLAQPLKRRTIFGSIFLGLSVSFGLAVLIGMGVPLLVVNPTPASALLLLVNLLLTFVFIALALFAGLLARDKARGMGLSLMLWVYFVLIFDGIVLMLMYNFSDYPIEKFVLYITLLNPVDLARILVLMQTEASAMMGYSGAVFNSFFTSSWGIAAAILAMMLWAAVPAASSFFRFRKKDL